MFNLSSQMRSIGKAALNASRFIATADSASKSKAIRATANLINLRSSEILQANQKDLENGNTRGLSSAMLDRLMLNEERLNGICNSLLSIDKITDPVGTILAEWSQPNGLHIRRVRTPIGVIGIIYESRPNVTIDAGALCIKSGNAAILRGGTDSWYSSAELHKCIVDGLDIASIPPTTIQRVPTKNREAVGEMLRMAEYIDVIVPRGGKSLVERVQNEARIPVFAHLEGICHVYIDKDADIKKARNVVINSKTRRTGICGAAECLLIDKAFYKQFGAPFISDLIEAGVEVRADGVLSEMHGTVPASSDDFGKEYLDMIISTRLVDGVEGAISHIQEYGSQHTDAIITESDQAKEIFFANLNSSILMCNASTQFADGGEFGLGAEIGIATSKIHARGPVSAKQLTSFKYVVEADGAIRK